MDVDKEIAESYKERGPLRCRAPGCPAGFHQEAARIWHVRNAHGLACSECGTGFGSVPAFTLHMQRKHMTAPREEAQIDVPRRVDDEVIADKAVSSSGGCASDATVEIIRAEEADTIVDGKPSVNVLDGAASLSLFTEVPDFKSPTGDGLMQRADVKALDGLLEQVSVPSPLKDVIGELRNALVIAVANQDNLVGQIRDMRGNDNRGAEGKPSGPVKRKRDNEMADLECECGQKFARKSGLMRHKRRRCELIPESELPDMVSCDSCGKRLCDQDSLHRHRRNGCSVKRVTCAECGRVFKGEKRLTNHMMLEHNR